MTAAIGPYVFLRLDPPPPMMQDQILTASRPNVTAQEHYLNRAKQMPSSLHESVIDLPTINAAYALYARYLTMVAVGPVVVRWNTVILPDLYQVLRVFGSPTIQRSIGAVGGTIGGQVLLRCRWEIQAWRKSDSN